MSDEARCEVCGEPMPPGEEMFKYHGYSGPCPKPPLPKPKPMVFAWVIERDTSEPSRPEYFTGKTHPALCWSDPGDHAAAIRFARKVDAERMALFDSARKHRVCEHGWEE